MNIILVGYRKWAYELIKSVIRKKGSHWNIRAIITTHNPEIDYTTLPIPCIKLDPKDFETEKTQEEIKRLKPNILVFYGWSWLIPKSVYKNYTCLILHPSPLPKYRGGSPLQHQIIAGERKSAVSIFAVGDGLDNGDIYTQTTFSLNGNMNDIFARIVKIGITDSIKIFDGLADKTLLPTPQDHTQATYFARRKPNESELTMDDLKNKTSEELYNFIRALTDPYPNAYIKSKDGKKLFITGARLKKDGESSKD